MREFLLFSFYSPDCPTYNISDKQTVGAVYIYQKNKLKTIIYGKEKLSRFGVSHTLTYRDDIDSYVLAIGASAKGEFSY